jgi:non-canonical (house-cleaning) NTP pyrophosphatase
MPTIVVASNAPCKLKATHDAFEILLDTNILDGEGPITVNGFDAVSGVATQPVTLCDGFSGAHNRVDAAIKEFPDADYIIGIENCLVTGAYKDAWLDMAVIKVRTREGIFGIATSVGIEVPSNIVLMARLKDKTIGEVLSDRMGDDDPQDPHSELTSGMMSRTDLLREGIIAAVGVAHRK